MTRKFLIPGDQIKPVAVGYGGCIASDRITVEGMKVGYLYRESPTNGIDSGWRILAGDESAEYMNDSNNHTVYDVNTIANYDPTITAVLETEPPCAFEWDASSSRFVSIPQPDPDPE